MFTARRLGEKGRVSKENGAGHFRSRRTEGGKGKRKKRLIWTLIVVCHEHKEN